jgi:hypothetical protein
VWWTARKVRSTSGHADRLAAVRRLAPRWTHTFACGGVIEWRGCEKTGRDWWTGRAVGWLGTTSPKVPRGTLVARARAALRSL